MMNLKKHSQSRSDFGFLGRFLVSEKTEMRVLELGMKLLPPLRGLLFMINLKWSSAE